MPARSNNSARSGPGFTLVEVMLAIALMVLAAAVLLPAAGAFFRQAAPASIDDTVAEILQEVRRESVLSGREVTLRFEAGAQRFTWEREDVARHQVLPGPRVTVEFLRAHGAGAVLLGGQLVQLGTVPAVTFFPDGTCQPVRVQLRQAGGAARVLVIDPWTCAPGLEAKS